MKKKIFKYSIIGIILLILIVTSIIGLLLNKKGISSSSILGKTETMLNGSETTEGGENYTYNTSGDDPANYVDGDTSGEKSHWVKNGDTWTYTFYVDDPNAQWYIWEDSETLMEGYSGDYTENNIGNIFETTILNEFTPNASMSSKVDSNGNTVYTWLDSQNAYKVTENGDGTYTKVTTKLSFTITNTKQGVEAPVVEKGSLTIEKIVKDSDGNMQTESDDNTNFQFTITLTAGTADSELIEGTKIFGNIVFKNKVATVALKAGNSVTIPDLPAGITYTIAENEYAEYEVSYEGESGTISKGVESRATITNTKKSTQQENTEPSGEPEEPDDPEQKYVDITIKKSVTGNNEINEEYTIELELNELKENKTYELSNGTSFKANSEGSANVSIKLSNDQSVTIKDIPVGTKYKAFEYAGDYISSYVITDANNKGLIANTANRNTKTNVAISTATETADEDENVTITFTNKKIVTQNLKLTKTVTDEDDTNSYLFDIEFGNMEEGSSFNSTAGRVIAEQNGKAELSVYLSNEEVVEFYDVPVGTTYRVKELASSSIASYTVIDSNGLNKIAKTSDSNTKAKKALSTEIETVNQGEDVTINFINNTVNQEPDSAKVSLGVTKNVQNKDGKIIEECEDSFDFELTAGNVESGANGGNTQNGEDYPMPEKTNAKIIGNGTASFGEIIFTKTGTYTYKITEKSGNSEDYEYDKSEYIITFEVTNPEGLLEINQTIKKDGFNSDVIVFTNKTDKYEEKEPDSSGNPDEPDEQVKPDDNKDSDDNEQEDENKAENEEHKDESKNKQKENKQFPQTGQTRVVYIIFSVIIVISVAVIVSINYKIRKNNNEK